LSLPISAIARNPNVSKNAATVGPADSLLINDSGSALPQKLTLPASCTVRPARALVTRPKSAAPKVAPGMLKLA
jgi:hypothetical protein